MDKKCLINQPAGLGDIMFCQKIADRFIEEGYDVVWPVIPQFISIKNHLIKDGLTFCSEDEDFIMKEAMWGDSRCLKTDDMSVIYIPLRYADRYISGSVMDAKYAFCDLEIGDWRDAFPLTRDESREEELVNHLGISDDEEFILVNNQYGSPPGTITREIDAPDNIRQIKMSYIDGYSLFDWIGVMAKAKEIHTVETSVCYILDKLVEDIQPDRLVMYSKKHPIGFDHLANVYKREDWEKIV